MKLLRPSELPNNNIIADTIENPDSDDVITEESITEDTGTKTEHINLNPVVNVLEDQTNPLDNNNDVLIGPEDDPIQATIRAYQTFDKNAWNKKSGFKMPHFPFIQQKLEGLDEGLYLFAAESNAG